MSRIQDFDFSVNLLQVLLWQYNEAHKIEELLTNKQNWVNDNQRDFWQNWYDDVFNLQTANDFGLAVWAIILNLPLTVGPSPDPAGKPIFGFGTFNQNFNNGNFSSRDSSIFLTTEEKRLLLRLRYYQLVSNGVIPDANRFLKEVFKDFGQVYLLDGLDMTITCVFTFTPDSRLLFMLKRFDLIPRPSGVKLRYIAATGKVFGFGQFNQNFNNGNFLGTLTNGSD
jgi:hypothetical protein